MKSLSLNQMEQVNGGNKYNGVKNDSDCAWAIVGFAASFISVCAGGWLTGVAVLGLVASGKGVATSC